MTWTPQHAAGPASESAGPAAAAARTARVGSKRSSDSVKLRKQGPGNPAGTPYADRLQALRNRLRERPASRAFDALLVVDARNIRYLTGFVGDDSWLLVPLRGKTEHLVTDFRFEEQVTREAPHLRMWVREQGGMSAAAAKLMDRLKLERLGVPESGFTLAQRKALLKPLGASRLRAVDDGLLEQRAVKDPGEVERIEAALDIQQRAFEELLGFARPGMSEFELAGYLEYRMRVLGADGVSFPSIVAADANAALPHAIPGPDKLRQGGLLLVDWGARKDGYCSDLTRTLGVGSMPRKMREVYRVVLEAQEAAIEAIRPGVKLAEIDAVARDHIASAGYGERFGHSLGHGIGLLIHEQPTLSKSARGSLAPGHVVTVEPGIYLPGVGGVRIEDDVLVTPTGHRVLSRLPKGLDSAML